MKVKVNNQTNVIIYCRVSTDEQRKGTSVEVQEERLREYCKRMGYNIIELPNFKEDESAKTFKKRPVMQSILKYIKSHKKEVDKLLFFTLESLFTRFATSGQCSARLTFYGCRTQCYRRRNRFQ